MGDLTPAWNAPGSLWQVCSADELTPKEAEGVEVFVRQAVDGTLSCPVIRAVWRMGLMKLNLTGVPRLSPKGRRVVDARRLDTAWSREVPTERGVPMYLHVAEVEPCFITKADDGPLTVVGRTGFALPMEVMPRGTRWHHWQDTPPKPPPTAEAMDWRTP